MENIKTRRDFKELYEIQDEILELLKNQDIDFKNVESYEDFKSNYKNFINSFIKTPTENLVKTYSINNAYEAVNIPMDEILLKLGYDYKREKCTRRNYTMQNENGDLVVISRMPNEHYLYFNPFNDNDRGNIHNFCRNRGVSLKEILFNNTFECKHQLQYTNPQDRNEASLKANANFDQFKRIEENDYLLKRGIPKEISSHFNIRLDNHNNVCFPHFTLTDKVVFQSGYTAKLRNPLTKDRDGNILAPNKYIKSICYGNKGLEILKQKEVRLSDIQNIIITESSIDSMSLFALNTNPDMRINNTLFCATGGNKNQGITEVLEFLKNKTEAKFILGMDNDEKGQYFNEQLKEILKGKEIIQLQPQLKDFNDDLKATKLIKEGRLFAPNKSLKDSLEILTCKTLKDLKKAPQNEVLINRIEEIKLIQPLNPIQSRIYKEIKEQNLENRIKYY